MLPYCTTLLLLSLMSAALSGCTIIENSTHTLITEPLKFPTNLNRVRTKRANKMLAREHLERVRVMEGVEEFSLDFFDGFVAGFADYLSYGGNGLEPVVPPRKYWRMSYRSPQGQAAVSRVVRWFSPWYVRSTKFGAPRTRYRAVVDVRRPGHDPRRRWRDDHAG